MQGRPNHAAPKRRASPSAQAGADALTLRPGSVLGGYELLVRLARGETSEVWLARGGDRDLAIKALRLDVPQTPELLLGFAREVTIATRLHHPNIVELLDSGRAGEQRYLVLEYVDGLTLAQLGRRPAGQRLPLGLLARLLGQVCLALHHAHELSDDEGWLGFLHRDVCPENILVSAAGTAKLTDFGAARMRSVPEGAGPPTRRRRYAAPERVQGLSEDRRADLYSIGVILYEQATGQPPFQGNELELTSQIVAGRPTDPRRLVPGFPEPLAQIVTRAMATDRDDRYLNCQALADALDAFVALEGEARDSALTSDLLTLFESPSEEPWEAQPLPARDEIAAEQETAVVSTSRERFAPDADFSNDDITRPTEMSIPEEASNELVVEAQVPAPTTPAAPGDEAWLASRQQALARTQADLFAEPHPAPVSETERPLFRAPPPREAPSPSGIDVFSLYGRAAVAPPEPPPLPRPEPPPSRRATSPAAQRFDRGLELLGAKLHELALAEWEEACRLDPENRLYRTNLKRLRAQLAARAGQTERE